MHSLIFIFIKKRMFRPENFYFDNTMNIILMFAVLTFIPYNRPVFILNNTSRYSSPFL